MRRLMAVILCLFLCSTTVYGANTANSVSTTAEVSDNGSCRITVDMTIALDEPVSGLRFSLGSGISEVTVNGAQANLSQSGGVTSVNLDYLDGKIGTYDVSVQFQINSVVKTDEDGRRIVTVPLLFGFPYPVEAMEFSVKMPGAFNSVPAFFSGYHGQDIERSMTSGVRSTVISGKVNTALKDSETMYMELMAPEDMFQTGQTFGGSLAFDGVAMAVCAAAAFLYWLLRLSRLPSLPTRRATPPEGITAGSLGSYLVRRNADLNMMVLTWAQLGYLIIHMDENGRVFLHKKMNMGNERNEFERRIFRNLFGRKQSVDSTGYHYAKLCEKTAQISRSYSTGYRSTLAQSALFRLLSAAVGLFAGVAMADSFVTSHTWRVVAMAAAAVVCFLACWQIQEGMYCLHLRARRALWNSLACCAGMLAAGWLCGGLNYAMGAVGWNLFAGLAAAYGGRRSQNGLRLYTEILGLRRYMRKVEQPELARILKSNPDYYYELAPYAMALGVDKRFAQRFGDLRQPACTWLVTGIEVRTAPEWYGLLRDAVNAMEREQNRTFWDKLFHRK